ncbi:hypothetical protein Vafri_6750, partial [Volvox africanus]
MAVAGAPAAAGLYSDDGTQNEDLCWASTDGIANPRFGCRLNNCVCAGIATGKELRPVRTLTVALRVASGVPGWLSVHAARVSQTKILGFMTKSSVEELLFPYKRSQHGPSASLQGHCE